METTSSSVVASISKSAFGQPWPDRRTGGFESYSSAAARSTSIDGVVSDGTRVHRFTADVEQLSARCEHGHVRAAGEQMRRERGDRSDELLTVVEHEKLVSGTDRSDQAVDQRGVGDRLDAERLRNLVDQHVGVAHRCEFDHATPSG